MSAVEAKITPAVKAPLLFGAAEFIDIELKREKKAVSVRFPTDDEFASRQRKMKTIISRQSGGSSTTETQGQEAADMDLLSKITKGENGEVIAQPDTEACDEFEAGKVLGKLTEAESQEAERDGEYIVVPVKVLGGVITRHTVRMPSEKEIRKYRKGAFSFIDLRHGKQELKSNLLAIGDFYDLLKVQTEGYAPGVKVPLVHKVPVISELMSVLDDLDNQEDPNSPLD